MSDVAKLGQVHDTAQGRDAVHVAIFPAVAAQILAPGDHVGLVPGSADEVMQPNDTVPALGIVDPFIRDRFVQVGARFFVFLYPQTITGLRHVWTHPAFQAEGVKSSAPTDPVEVSKAWIRDFAAAIDQTEHQLMEAAALWLYDENYTYDNSGSYKGHWGSFPEFWKHYEVVTGRKPKEATCFFTCSC